MNSWVLFAKKDMHNNTIICLLYRNKILYCVFMCKFDKEQNSYVRYNIAILRDTEFSILSDKYYKLSGIEINQIPITIESNSLFKEFSFKILKESESFFEFSTKSPWNFDKIMESIIS